MAHADLNALGLGDTLRAMSAPSFKRAPVAEAEPAIPEDFAALPGATPSAGTGHRVLDLVMRPDAPLPPAIRAVTGAPGGKQAGRDSVADAGSSGTITTGDVATLLRGMREAELSPPSGSVQLAQAGASDVPTMLHMEGKAAATPPAHPLAIAVPVAQLKTSSKGLAFIEKEEEQPGVSNTLHHPSAASGVTLGPGYDMKNKTVEQITKDLELIGIKAKVAEKIAGASHLAPDKIDKFIEDNRALINLTSLQQAKLLAFTIGTYEDKVRRNITVPLKPYEFDALVSFLYNPGHGWPDVCVAINNGDFNAAAEAMKKQTKSGKKVLSGLVRRRQHETDLLLNGNYGAAE
ncbi:glycoside hydrolase family protein [Acetobacteraceae bacterium KSS8]|uniref:Lysozyme n=1 Tax=Endosaccharibacter trunci TaxID=2812733 RepID=A0ABT1W874_9PROT|nr:glycoside hydrolase family protein [Acetobacteraceae bacterium KSS8]